MPVLQRVSVSLKNILLATDFSSASDLAAAYAKALALNFRSSVEIVHAFDPSVVTTYVEAILGVPVKDRRRVVNDSLASLKMDFTVSGIEATTALPEGHKPHLAVLKLARDHETDLIVAGTHSRWGLERLVIGSTAEDLIRNAACPVLTVGPHAKKPADGPLVFRTIIYATDFSVEAAKAAVYALSFAQDSGAHLYFCHVAPAGSTTDENVSLDARFKADLKRMIPESSYEWCTPEPAVIHGAAAEGILELAERVDADLIVLGARNASFWLTHIEHGLTPDLLAEASCPVMTVC
ncbi:MAG: universal stress protein [Acidobacteriota bacterium]|nr:universal stress protein [Acidobacteriota bacterium]